MEALSNILRAIDDFVWGPVMLILLVGTGIFLTIRTSFLPWRNLGYAIKSTLSREARQKKGAGDVSPFSALMTALAATIGTGNIVGVATAMVSGGPGALVWMWISAAFGLSSKFSECMLSIKYREVNEKGEMSGGPMYTMKKALKHKRLGAILGWCFALFAVIASFGIGNLTQSNSISTAMDTTFHVPLWVTGLIIAVLVLAIIVGGIKSISKVSAFVVPFMAIFYVICGLIVIIGNYENIPDGVRMIFSMAFSVKAVGGGLCGTITSAMMNAMRFGVARGVFSNEAGMGSAAITAAAATTDSPVRQGYINMTGTFWDTIVVCTITGLCIASSGVLGATQADISGTYRLNDQTAIISYLDSKDNAITQTYEYVLKDNTLILTEPSTSKELVLTAIDDDKNVLPANNVTAVAGAYTDEQGNHYHFSADGIYTKESLVVGAALTILAFQTVLGDAGGWMVCIGIALFAFSTILGWEYHGEKAVEYLLHTHKYNMVYRILFAIVAYFGATTALEIVWSFSDIANALMAIPNLICLLALSGEIAKDMKEFQPVLKAEQAKKQGRN